MPLSYLPTTNLSINAFYNYYDAPTTHKGVGIALNSFSGITYPNTGTHNNNMGYYASNSYMFYFKAVNTNGTKGTISITYPWSQSTNTTNGYVGGGKQAFIVAYPYITLSVSTNYGYTFRGWYTAASGGTYINATGVQNIYYTDTYRDYVWYAQWY